MNVFSLLRCTTWCIALFVASGAVAQEQLDDNAASDAAGRPPAEGTWPADDELDADDAMAPCREAMRSSYAKGHHCLTTSLEVDEEHPLTLELKLLADPKPNSPSLAGIAFRRVVREGMGEALATGAFVGGVDGWLLAAVLSSAFRINDDISLPMLFAGPAIGAVAGAGLMTATSLVFGNHPGESALMSSMAVQGLIHSVLLQPRVLTDVWDLWLVPARFASVAGAMTGAAFAGGLMGRLLSIDAGDVGVANSAAIWAPVLTFFAASTFGVPVWWWGAQEALQVSSLAAFAAALCASPWLNVHRSTTWFLELGGLFGLVLPVVFAPFLGFWWGAAPLVWGVSTAGGLGLGVGAMVASHVFLDGRDPLGPVIDVLEDVTGVQDAHLGPQLMPPLDRRVSSAPSPGVGLVGRFR